MSGETRRRGAALEEALLEAAWQELVAVGYARFTIEGVAARAGTSRPVIYRRWPDRSELAVAAVRHFGRTEPVPTPDTGSVRDDLITLLRDASKGRTELAALFSVQMGEFFAETGRTRPTCAPSSSAPNGSRSGSSRCCNAGSSAARSTPTGSRRGSPRCPPTCCGTSF